ncbi:hypothetical protein [uncultured Desulfobacter sp.]|uniref:hypothetical protein n=1 Tax=uncultured Desulfobacter sp. TaxID=240139 RepID=UPI0029F522F2|nr:hypothetical protein [uncultured Desulfobacter sp.]
MVKRAKLTLESDPVENDLTQPTDVPPETPSGQKETLKTEPKAPAKKSGLFKTVLFFGLTIASIAIFKRKIF